MEMPDVHVPEFWVCAVGIIGCIISSLVYLAPVPTFIKIYKRRSIEGFQSVPYVVSVFSATLWIYYALMKQHTYMLISINAIGCFIQAFYIAVFLFFAPRSAKISTTILLLILNVAIFGPILLYTLLFSKPKHRVRTLGWICVVFSVVVFAAPLGVIKLVIRTKSVEYMPLPLSLAMTINAMVWLTYGFLIKDHFVAMPNVLGILLALIQIVLYMCYNNAPVKQVRDIEDQSVPAIVEVETIELANKKFDHQEDLELSPNAPTNH